MCMHMTCACGSRGSCVGQRQRQRAARQRAVSRKAFREGKPWCLGVGKIWLVTKPTFLSTGDWATHTCTVRSSWMTIAERQGTQVEAPYDFSLCAHDGRGACMLACWQALPRDASVHCEQGENGTFSP